MRAFPISRRISPRSTRPAPATTDAAHSPRTAAAHNSEDSGARWNGLRRAAALTAAATVACSVGVAFAPSAGAAISAPIAPENAAARAGIAEAVAAQPDPTVIPEDFVTTAGYRPVIESGMLVNPQGDCSSPIPLPAEFELACKSHDLGYDLLRYAAAHGQPLGPWARQAVDATLEQRMDAACETRTNAVSRAQCRVMADVATTAVDLNSIRQDYGNPITEPFFERDGDLPSPATLTLAGIGLAVGLATATTMVVRRTRSRRPTEASAPTPAPAPSSALAAVGNGLAVAL